MLRRYLAQAERITKLTQLNLKNNPKLFENEIALYRTGYLIVEDIQRNLDSGSASYYSYSGVGHFAQHLREFLENYEIENNRVIHRSQKASRALVQAIQILTLPRNKLTEEVKEKLAHCNKVIAVFGSEEQRKLHKITLQNTIQKQQEQNTAFYRSILHNFQEHMQEVNS